VTRLTLNSAVFSSSTTASLRDVEVFELATPEVSLWLEQPAATLTGAQVLVPDAAAARLEEGRTVILSDGAGDPHVAKVLSLKPDTWFTGSASPFRIVEIDPPLPRPFSARDTRLAGNVALSTHGETVARERLGRGDAAQPFASFDLAKPRVTHVPKPGARWGAASTLRVRVAGVLWDEVESFYGTTPRDRVYVTDVDDDQKMHVRFGDGETGARVPTGAEIVAGYREGIGFAGLVRAGALTNALDRPVGLKAVTNPLPASGAGEPETLDDAREQAPITVRTLGRIVSLRDFEDGAIESAIVAKARATHLWSTVRLAHIVRLVVAGEGGSQLQPASLADVLADLDARRDPNRLVELVPHRPADIVVGITVVERDAKLLPEDVAAAVRAKLDALFAFENRAFGQPVHASDVLAAVQAAAGIHGAALTALHRTDDPPPPDIVEHVPIADDELARLDVAALQVVVP
jgi:predicted phage baseplate assembly protein